MDLKAGFINDLSGSMAKAMEDAFLQEWPSAMGEQTKPEMNTHMQLLFVAIAQGVVRHLAANTDAFSIVVSEPVASSGTHKHTATLSIKTIPPL